MWEFWLRLLVLIPPGKKIHSDPVRLSRGTASYERRNAEEQGLCIHQ